MGKSKKSGHKKLHSKTRKNHYGGNLTLAYPSNNFPSIRTPALAYTGKEGNISNAYPSMGPPGSGFNFLNPQVNQRGGCGCSTPLMTGGNKCSLCNMKLWGGSLRGGSLLGGRHRIGCKCSLCKSKMSGGTGNNGIPYPNGLVGSPWQPSVSSWPGVNNVSGDSNYLAYNTYPTDVQTAIIDTNSNPSKFTGGKRKHKRKKLRGGTLSNFFGQDLINVGRQFQFGVGSAYNALAGYSAPVNPLPWKDQLVNTPSLSTVKAASYY